MEIALTDDDVSLSICLSVRLSPIAHMWLVWKLPNLWTWKFITMLGPWMSITGCWIM